MRQKADEAAAITAVDGVKENGKVFVFSFFGKAHDDHERIYNVVTEFIAADGDKPEKVTLGTVPAAAPSAPAEAAAAE